ncbi:MAG: hypothetical protein IPK93_11675 [Solirubrobacterales bacterium]|nr:hypothetical protein [Solirubrobacterales bacterium]
MRRLMMVTVALLATSLIHLSGPASGATAKPRLGAKILTTGQKRLVNKRILKVKVRSAGRGRVRVRALSTTYDLRGRYKRFTRVARPRFKRARQVKIVKLRVTKAGYESLQGCEDRDLKVQAGKVESRVRSLVRQSTACAPQTLDLSRSDRCDYIAMPTPTVCMTPFPNNFYTRADETTESGRRINFRTDAMPVNDDGKPINAAPYNQSDGFSQGQTITVRVPGLDNFYALAQTNPVGLTDPERYLDPDAPVVVINAETGERQPIWVELDSSATNNSNRNLLIHPMVNFDAGARYIVALRNLDGATGATISAPPGFRYYRDMLPSRSVTINKRRSSFEDIFRRLRREGIQRANLYLSWDFTVASDENNSSRALSMRDQAFAELGDSNLGNRDIPASSASPSFTVTSTDDYPNPQVVRRIKGKFSVPCYMKHPTSADNCATGATLNLNPAGVPVKTGTYEANFDCIVPHAVVDSPSAAPGRALVYGHGLLGSIGGEIDADSQLDLADEHGFVVCGTDEIGMSLGDAGTVISALTDLNNFPKVADRLQQGLLNELYLARLMVHPDGFTSAPGFRVDPMDMNSDPVINTTSGRAFYRGNSQGGILGGALTALAPDFDRAALGVSAMNFSVLMNRSAAWATFSTFFNPSYRNELERPLVLGLAQMLWDRGEPNGYAHRMTDDPLPDTPSHKVLMDIAFGDHLVSNWQSNVMARTIGARAVNPFVYSGRWPGVNGQWGIEPVPTYPYDGSAISYWDSGPVRPDPGNPGETLGNGPPPITNTTPSGDLDPHEDPRRADTAQQMVSDFLKPNGRVTNPCAPGACYAGEFTGP